MTLTKQDATTYTVNIDHGLPHQIRGRTDNTHKLRCVIGGQDTSKFAPNANMRLWSDGEAFFNINFKQIVIGAEKLVEEEMGPAIKAGELTFFADDRGSGINIGMRFDAIPTITEIVLSITKSQGLQVFYQPEISDFHLQELRTRLSKPNLSKRDIRPAHVVGSLAIYYGKMNHAAGSNNYGTGKFCHLYRWYCTDSNDKTQICGSLVWDVAVSEITIALPMAWLKNAAYPVRVNP